VRPALLLLLSVFAAPLVAQTAAPDSLFTLREEMVPMRDGKRLYTAMLIPRNATAPLPFLMMRTPYGAKGDATAQYVTRVNGEMLADGYIFVFQDIRGLHQSEGAFVMNRPPRPAGSTESDESTDTWDTIDWLVKNVTPNNGRVGMLGVSYPGWTTAIAGLDPHPALKAISPQALAVAVCCANSSETAEAVLQLVLPLNCTHTSRRYFARLKLEYTITPSTISTKTMPQRTGFFMIS
jgi:putative CocE/NonD family hydrolase